MVFESVVAELLNRYLGEYVENLDGSQLSIGIWGGDVVLTDLCLKQSALDELNLPIKTIYGHLGKLVLKIPWKNLYNAPTIASIERLFLLAVPNHEIKYDPVKEEKWKQQAKQDDIARVEAAKKRAQDKNLPKTDDSFAEKLIAQIVKNVEIKVKDVHIRYEDRFSSPLTPFSIGITLHNLVITTTDKDWCPSVNQDPSSYIFKQVMIEGGSIYWNSKSELFSLLLPNEQTLREKFLSGIPTQEKINEGYKYIIGPISCGAKLQLNMKPELDNYRVPKVLLIIQLRKVRLQLLRSQYTNLIALLDSIDRMMRAACFRKYRPDVQTYRGHYRKWWHYAYACVLEEVRRRNKNWDWKYILEHRRLCHGYEKAFKEKLQTGAKVDDIIKFHEQELDAFNIILIRQKVELEVEAEGKKKKVQVKREAKGWFSSWWSSSPGDDGDDDDDVDIDDIDGAEDTFDEALLIKKKIRKVMTPAEKEKLFKAIGYQENSAPDDVPESFIAFNSQFSLESLEFNVLDDTAKRLEILGVIVRNVTLHGKLRPVSNGFSVSATMYDFTVNGVDQDKVVPQLCTSLNKEMNAKAPLVKFFLETSPLDIDCDTHIQIEVTPLRIVFDARTVMKLADVFTVEEEKTALLDQLQSAANSKLTEMKEKSALGLQFAIQKRSRLKLSVEIMSSYIIIPENGFYSANASLLVYDIGRLSVTSVQTQDLAPSVQGLHKLGAGAEEILETMMTHSYDKFIFMAEDVQVILANPDEQWLTCLKNHEHSDLHLLHPTTLKIEISKCLITDDPRLPKLKVRGELPNLILRVFEKRLFDTIKILTSIPFSEPKSAKPVNPLDEIVSGVFPSSSSIFRLDRDSDKIARAMYPTLDQAKPSDATDDIVQFTDVDASFQLNEIVVDIISKDVVTHKDTPFLNLKLMKFEAKALVQTFSTTVDLSIGGLSLIQFYRKIHNVNIIQTPLADGEDDYLFVLKYVFVDKTAPDFHTHYKSVIQLIEANISRFKILLHLESLLVLLEWVSVIQASVVAQQPGQLTATKSGVDLQKKKTLAKSSHLLGIKEMPSKLSYTTAQSRKSKRKPIETVDLKLKASVEEITIVLASLEHRIGKLNVGGGVAGVLMKKSYTQLDVKLQDLYIIDFKETCYPKVISTIEKEELISVQVVMFNDSPERKQDDISITITASISCIRVIYINRFFITVMTFMNNFQAAQEQLYAASQAAAEAAKVNMQQAYSAALKIKLNIDFKAPVFIIPLNSKSFNAILADFGLLTIRNSFQDIETGMECNAVLDQISVNLDNVKISRVQLNKDVTINSETLLLEPITCQLFVQRNLSCSWYTNLPDIDIGGNFNTISIKLHKDDYIMVLSILAENLGEVDAVYDTISMDEGSVRCSLGPDDISIKNESKTSFHTSVPDQKSDLIARRSVYTFLKFTVRLESLIVELFNTETRRSSLQKSETLPERTSLAKLEIYLLSLKGAVLSDDTYVASALLLDFLIDDTRSSQAGKITRYMERIPYDSFTSTQNALKTDHERSMIDITFRMKGDAIFVDLRVFSFNLILNIQYLMKLYDYFTSDLPEQEKTVDASKFVKSTSTVASVPNAARPGGQELTRVINVCIEKPDIILVENLESIDTNALILEMELVTKIHVVDEQLALTGTVKDLQLFTCCYNKARRHETKVQVLRPVSINITASSPQKDSFHLDVSTTNIHFAIVPGTIELLNRCYNTLYSEGATTEQDDDLLADRSAAWEMTPFNEADYWFLRSEVGVEAIEELKALSIVQSTVAKLSEICLINVPSFVVSVEAGTGSYTLPMLLMESSIKGNVKNWSTELTADVHMTLQVSYFNSKLAFWEPFIEPIEVIQNDIAQPYPWELTMKLEKHIEPTSTESLGQSQIDLSDRPAPPQTIISITSEESIEVTITKTCLSVLQSLAASFNEAIYKPFVARPLDVAPFVLKNDTGMEVVVLFSSISFQLKNKPNEPVTEVIIEPGAKVSLCSNASTAGEQTRSKISSLDSIDEKYIMVRILTSESTSCELEIPVSRAEKRYFTVVAKDSYGDQEGVISDLTIEGGSVILTLSSIVRIYNHFKTPINVYYMTEKGNEVELIGEIQSEKHLNLPAHTIYTKTKELFFSLPGYSLSVTPYVWRDIQKTFTLTKLLQCDSKNSEDKEPFFIKAIGEMEQVYYELSRSHTMTSTCFNLHLRPAVILKNFLPIDIIVFIQGIATEHVVKSGDRIEMPTIEPGSSSVVIRLHNYLDKDWSCKQSISENPPALDVWTFESYNSPQRFTFDLGMHTVNKNGSLVLALYCPFWMINKTGLLLCYRHADDMSNFLYHPHDLNESVMFSFRAKNFFGKKKACIKIENGEWSEKFSLDVAGSSGIINCKVKDKFFKIGVHIELMYNTLTKQVTFTPYYILLNHCSVTINCLEVGRKNNQWLEIAPESCVPFWPNCLENKMILRMADTKEETIAFPFDDIQDSLLKLENKYGGVNVNVQNTEGAVYVMFNNFKAELAPALIMNNTRHDITIQEKDQTQKILVTSKHKILFSWSKVGHHGQISWDGGKRYIDICKDDIGEFKLDNSTVYYVTFLNGMQRILLFTTNMQLASGIQNMDLASFEVELNFSLHGVGLSLVENIKHQEILYLGITSSGIIWESTSKLTKRFKPFSETTSNNLEIAYQKYLQDKSFSQSGTKLREVEDKMVDFEEGLIVKPNQRYIRRVYNTGLWLQTRTSKYQIQVHAKINKLQIDNQLYDCVFPVVLAPVPPPKSVALLNVSRPFFEVSILQRLSEHTSIVQYKYFKVLVQEFHIKLDIGFINALTGFFEAGEVSDAVEVEQFAMDRSLVNKELMSLVSIVSTRQQKNFYDYLHFSPLKIHLSFSLSSGGNMGITSLPPLVSLLTQSLGVTLTDMQDVVFKLSYFERQYTFLSNSQLMNEVQMHYLGQFFKQVYVFVFGLDVLGNPYGLVVGLKQGVEDLFYEPFQGAIQGPGEFAEGVYLGVKSLFGHTIGGAAGAMSRITGAMGKGLAALTFDEEYQRKRREQINVRSVVGVQESMAQSGKGLVMGVVQGFGGVITKPITGAKEEGIEGFFKGFGKGVVGLVTRPGAGVVDFASGTFSSVKKITQSNEEVARMRNPRSFKRDSLIQPYCRLEAEGTKLLMEIEKGRLQATDCYIYHIPIGNKDVLLLTDNRILYLSHNDVFGGYQVAWSFTWDEIESPMMSETGISFNVSESKKKIFRSNKSAKLLLIKNPDLKQNVFTKIGQCLMTAGHQTNTRFSYKSTLCDEMTDSAELSSPGTSNR